MGQCCPNAGAGESRYWKSPERRFRQTVTPCEEVQPTAFGCKTGPPRHQAGPSTPWGSNVPVVALASGTSGMSAAFPRNIETKTLTRRMEHALKLRHLEAGGTLTEPVLRRLGALERAAGGSWRRAY